MAQGHDGAPARPPEAVKGDIYTIGTENPHEYVEVYRKLCTKCGAEMAMATDRNDRWHPFDPETKESHFSTCPAAKHFREGGR